MSCSVIEHYECVGIWLREPDLHRRLTANEPSELLLLHPAGESIAASCPVGNENRSGADFRRTPLPMTAHRSVAEVLHIDVTHLQ